MSPSTAFCLGWAACAIYYAGLAPARRYFSRFEKRRWVIEFNAYFWPTTVPLMAFIRASHRLLLGKDTS